MDKTALLLIGAAGAALAGTSAVFLFRATPDAAAQERRRLQQLDEHGRLAMGNVDEVRGRLVFYSYEVSSVSYNVAQDLSYFPEPPDEQLQLLSGQITVKYDRANPPNSMVHSSAWSGLGLAVQPITIHDSSLRRIPQ